MFWSPGSGGGAGSHEHALDDLTDVTVDYPAVDETLLFNGAMWVNAPVPTGGTHGLDDHSDVDLSGVADGDALVWDADYNLWVPGGAAGGVTRHGALTGLGDADDHPWALTDRDGGGHVVNVVAASGSATELDLADGNVHDVTLTDDCTITLTSPAAGWGRYMAVLLRQDGTGGRTVTWPASVVWVGGQPPTLQTAADTWDWVALVTLDGGTTWFAQHAGTTSAASSDTHREVAMHDYGTGLEPVTDAAGDWLYGIYPGA